MKTLSDGTRELRWGKLAWGRLPAVGSCWELLLPERDPIWLWIFFVLNDTGWPTDQIQFLLWRVGWFPVRQSAGCKMPRLDKIRLKFFQLFPQQEGGFLRNIHRDSRWWSYQNSLFVIGTINPILGHWWRGTCLTGIRELRSWTLWRWKIQVSKW